jgi:hypothetical protein
MELAQDYGGEDRLGHKSSMHQGNRNGNETLRNLKGGSYTGNLGVYGRIMLKQMLEEYVECEDMNWVELTSFCRTLMFCTRYFNKEIVVSCSFLQVVYLMKL